VIGVTFAEFGYLSDGLFKVNWLAQRFISKCMIDDWSFSVIVDINLYAFYTSLKILQIAFNLGITGQLIATQISIMRGVAKIIC
jgi:hypothetical protein